MFGGVVFLGCMLSAGLLGGSVVRVTSHRYISNTFVCSIATVATPLTLFVLLNAEFIGMASPWQCVWAH